MLGEVDSTNDLLLARARRGEPEGLVLCARAQRRGRGRAGRRWHSPPGGGLYFSVLLRPPLEAPQTVSLPLVAGVCLAEALARLAGRPVGLKWPNDLRIGGKKVGGILCEFEPLGGPPPAVILGVGINLSGRPEEFPPELRRRASSLEAAGGPALAPHEALGALLEQLERGYREFLDRGFPPARRRWLDLCDNLGEEVLVRSSGAEVRGVVTGIDDSGRLRLSQADGSVISVDAGEVFAE